MGGWTRIWVIVVVIAVMVAATNYFSSMRAAESNALRSMNSALSAYDDCRRQLAGPRPTDSQLAEQAKGKGWVDALIARDMLAGAPSGNSPKSSTSAFDRYLAQTCSYAERPRDQYAQQQAQRRDDAIAKARGDAFGDAAATVGWAGGTVGALFLTVGWVWRGFRKRTQG